MINTAQAIIGPAREVQPTRLVRANGPARPFGTPARRASPQSGPKQALDQNAKAASPTSSESPTGQLESFFVIIYK